MDTERIKELRALCDAATEGPWREAMPPGAIHAVYSSVDDLAVAALRMDSVARTRSIQRANGRFIAAARTALPEALDAIEQRDREIAKLKKIIELQNYKGKTWDA